MSKLASFLRYNVGKTGRWFLSSRRKICGNFIKKVVEIFNLEGK
jgi:hypothetical protein